MSRTQEIKTNQQHFDADVVRLASGHGDPASIAAGIAATTCTQEPVDLDEWFKCYLPARAKQYQINVLLSVLRETNDPKVRESLTEALENLTANAPAWTKQLKRQAELADTFTALGTRIEQLDEVIRLNRELAKVAGVPVPQLSPEFKAGMKRAMEAMLVKIVIITCPYNNEGVIGYASARELVWLLDAPLMFKRAGISTGQGSLYQHALAHIDAAGILEEWPQFDDENDFTEMYKQDQEIEELERKFRAEQAASDSIIDEFTVAIDETIIETD